MSSRPNSCWFCEENLSSLMPEDVILYYYHDSENEISLGIDTYVHCWNCHARNRVDLHKLPSCDFNRGISLALEYCGFEKLNVGWDFCEDKGIKESLTELGEAVFLCNDVAEIVLFNLYEVAIVRGMLEIDISIDEMCEIQSLTDEMSKWLNLEDLEREGILSLMAMQENLSYINKY